MSRRCDICGRVTDDPIPELIQEGWEGYFLHYHGSEPEVFLLTVCPDCQRIGTNLANEKIIEWIRRKDFQGISLLKDRDEAVRRIVNGTKGVGKTCKFCGGGQLSFNRDMIACPNCNTLWMLGG